MSIFICVQKGVFKTTNGQEMEKELQDLLRGIGKDISDLRKGLVGTTKSILDNAKISKTHSSAQNC